MKKFLLVLLAIIIFLLPMGNFTYTIIQGIKFNTQCGDYLKLSADANNLEIAEKHLSKAIDYLEQKNLTSGYNKVFFYYPKNDIGLWYKNLKSTQLQLQETIKKSNYTELEESNMLMKLRETIMDDQYLTLPMGISIAEHFNLIWWLNSLMWLWWLVLLFYSVWLVCEWDYL